MISQAKKVASHVVQLLLIISNELVALATDNLELFRSMILLVNVYQATRIKLNPEAALQITVNPFNFLLTAVTTILESVVLIVSQNVAAQPTLIKHSKVFVHVECHLVMSRRV